MQTMNTKRESSMRRINIWDKNYQTRMIFLIQILKKMKAGFSPIVGIHGGQREGKTFIGIWLAYQIYKLNGKEFIPEKITFYDPDKAMISLAGRERDVVLIDEASDIMDYQEWRDKTHRALRSMINTQGYRNNLYIFISPFRAQIDRSLRIHADYSILVTKRGSFKVWRYTKCYDADDMKKSTKRYFVDYGHIKISDLPKEIWDRYLHYSIQEKERIREKRLKYDNSEMDISEMNERLITRVHGG